jgi:hypothetical protein
MLLRTAKQELRARTADAGTVNQHHNVIGRGVLTSILKTLRDRLKAHTGALQTIFHALFHLSAATFTNYTAARRSC